VSSEAETLADAEEAREIRGVLSLAAPAGYAAGHVKRLVEIEQAVGPVLEWASKMPGYHINEDVKRLEQAMGWRVESAQLALDDIGS
jgi:hypothetical protein